MTFKKGDFVQRHGTSGIHVLGFVSSAREESFRVNGFSLHSQIKIEPPRVRSFDYYRPQDFEPAPNHYVEIFELLLEEAIVGRTIKPETAVDLLILCSRRTQHARLEGTK